MCLEIIALLVLGPSAVMGVMGFGLTVFCVIDTIRRRVPWDSALENVGCQWAASMMIAGTIFSLAAVCVLIGQGWAEGTGAAVVVVVINVLMQPLCLFLVWSAARKLVNALRGRAIYAGQLIPPEVYGPEQYREICRQFSFSGAAGLGVAVVLTMACLYPLLKMF